VIHDLKRIFLSPDLQSTIQIKSGFVVHKPKQIFKSQDLRSTIQNKYMNSQDKSTGTQFPDTIPATLITPDSLSFSPT
jgi:hypothetical protein